MHNRYRVSAGGDDKVSGTDSGDGCTTWMYIILYALKNGYCGKIVCYVPFITISKLKKKAKPL